MNSNTTSQFMDKQIMDLSNSQSTATAMNSSGGNDDFIDFMNHSDEKRDGIVPSYDFMPIRPGVGSSSPLPTTNHVSKFDSAEDDASLRTKINVSSNRNHNSLDIDEPAKFVLGQNQTPLNASLSASLVSEIDMTVKKYTDNLMHIMDGVSARLSQLETRTRKLENSMDDLKESVGNNLGIIDGKLRQMGNILREVQTGVQVISDKQERVGELPAAKMLSSNLEQIESQNLAHTELTQSVASANQHFSTVSLTQPPPSLAPPPNAPPPQNSESHVQFPNYSQNQTTAPPQQESYFPPSGQTPQQQYQVPPLAHQHQHQHLTPPPHHQNQPPPPHHQHQPPPPPSQYSQPPPPQHQHQPPPPPQPLSQPSPPPQPLSQPSPPPQPLSQPSPPPQPLSQPSPPPQPHFHPPPPSQLHPPFSAINTSLPQPQLSHHSEETLYRTTQTYPPGTRPPYSHPSVGVPPPQQLYSPNHNVYESQSGRPIPGYSHSFGQSAGHVEPFPYSSSPSQYGSDSPRKPQQLPSNVGGLGGGSGYPQLPTARILPQAIPTASNVGDGSGSGGSGNKAPIDEVIDKVTHMGFPREQVRATVRKLTENGQSVDLNVVLDKLMNDGEGQAPRGWFGR